MIPVLIFIILIVKILELLRPLALLFVSDEAETPILGASLSLLISIIILLFLFLIAGLLAHTAWGKQLTNKLDGLLGGIPGYFYIKNSYTAYFGLEEGLSYPVVLAPIDGWMIGFIIEELDNDMVSVFVPGSPDPLAGNLIIFKKEVLKHTSLTHKQAFELLRRAGVGFRHVI